MKLIVNRIVAEFNKIFNGTKRVGDSLRLEGKRMNALDVANASTLGYKTESALSVSKSVVSEKTATLQSFSTNGNAVVDSNGNAVYLKENQLSVNNSQLLKGVEPANLEVDISRRLKVGSEPTSPVINVSNLIVDVVACRVKDSGLLGGKTESQLFVANAVNANNSNLLSNKTESTLSVERSRVSTRLISDVDGLEMRESQLRAYSTQTIKRGSENLDIYALRDYLFSTDQAKTIIVSTATSAQRLTAVGGDKTFADIITHIKNDSSVEAYKSTRLVTGSGATSTARTGDEYKNWFLEHVDFSNKIATLNANTSNRALRFGDATTNYSVAEMDVRIKTTVVDTAANSNKLQNYTAEELISLTRSRVLTDASNGQTGLTQLEVDGFFGNNRVKIALLGTKVTNSGNADTLGTKTLATIKQEIKDEGQVLTAKYLYSDPSMGGQKSYIDITSDILRAKNDVLDGATTEYNTLKKIENIVKSNKSTIETSLSSETSNRNIAVNLLQTNINTEKSRVDAILLGADTDKNSFAEIKTYIDGLTGSLSLSTTTLGNGVVRNVINITNALETRLVSYESSSTSTTSGLSSTVDRIEAAVGLATNGNLSPISGKHYVTGTSSVLNAVYALDSALKVEETTRNNKDVEAKTYADNIKIAVDGEITRAKAVEGTLNLLTSNNKMNLVSAINSVVADLATEISERSTNNTTLSDKINTTNTDLASEVSRAKSIEGTLTSLTTTNKTNLVEAINESITKIKSEETRALAVEGSLTSLTTTNKTNLVSAINELRTSITTETNSRVTAISNSENSLSTQINSEKTRINKIVEGLGFSNIDTLGTISFNETTYLNSKTKIKDALITLDESLRSVNSIQTNRTDVIVAQINAVVGLNGGITNYSNVINANSNYIKTATSMLDADNKLDAQIKVNTDAILKINADSSVNGSFAKGDLESLTSSKAYTDIRETNITTAYKNYADIETQRAKTIEGTLTSLTTTNKTNLVEAINESITKIKSEETRALAVEGSLTSLTTTNKTNLVSAINELRTSITTETNSRVTAISNSENSLSTQINSEKTRINKIVEGLGFSNIDTLGTISFNETTYLNSKTKIKDALITLDESLRSVNSIQTNRTDVIVAQINAVVGLNGGITNYSNVINANSNYIKTATSMLDADNKLDAQIKVNTDAILKINADSSVNGSFAKGDLESLTSSKAYTDIRETNITTAYKNYADIETQRAKTIEGTLTSLTTTNKTNLVNAINELDADIVGISTIYGSNGIINYELGTQIEIKQNVLTPTLRVSKSIELKDASQGYHKIDVVTSTVNQQDIHDLTYDGSRIVTYSNMQNAILKSGGVLTTDISRIHNVLGTSSSDTSYKSESTANYISSANNFKDADNKLDAQLKIVTDKANNSLSKTNNLSDLSDMVIARNNLDVYSTSQVENAINIAKLSLGTNYSTDDIVSRDTLVDLTVGDNIFVLDDGDGKWAIYRTVKASPNPTFQKIMDQDVFLENFNALQKTKLDGIESGAQVNTVYSVANKRGDVELEKSDVGLGDVENIKLSTWVGSNNINTVGTITLGTWDATPISNVTQNAVTAHQNALLITKSQITDFDVLDYELAIKVKNTAFNKKFGTDAETVAMGNDSRIINGQTAFNWGNHADAGYQQSSDTVTKNMTFGGHVSGTYANIVITDNSHKHTTANISDWESSLDNYVDNKVTDRTIYNNSNFGKTEIDALNINASTVNGKTVEENVPTGAVFTDTKYTLDTIYYDVVVLNANNFISNGDIVLEYEITKGGVSVVDDITKNIRVYIGGRKLRNTKFNIINTPSTKNMLVIESVMEVAGFSVGDEVEIERMVLTTI